MKHKDPLYKRYLFKLFTNLAGLFIGMITQAIIPRGLGPKSYGDFSFLSNFFTQVVGFFDMGTSTCFYTKLSKRPKEYKLVSFYFYFMVFAGALMILAMAIVQAQGISHRLWPDQSMKFVYMAVLLGLFTWTVSILSQMTDAYGLTVPAEVGKLVQKAITLGVIVALFVYSKLNLFSYFLYNYLVLFLLTAVMLFVMHKHDYGIFGELGMGIAEVRKYTREFFDYSHPLMIFSLVAMIAGIFDRWLLQTFGGSVQQGFFGLSDQIGAACFLFSGAMTPLILREFSIAHGNNDLKAMAEIFRKNIPLLYSITAFIACFIAVNAEKVTLIMGGSKFKGAMLPVALMAFYPIHRTYGQLSGSVFFAAGHTRLYRNIGIFILVLGLPFTYFFIAPKAMFGLDWGATGLAVKTLIIGFIGINIQLYFNARFLKLSFFKYFAHQLVSIVILLAAAVAVTVLAARALSYYRNPFADFFASGLLYTLAVLVIAQAMPRIFGLRAQDIERLKTIKFGKVRLI